LTKITVKLYVDRKLFIIITQNEIIAKKKLKNKITKNIKEKSINKE